MFLYINCMASYGLINTLIVNIPTRVCCLFGKVFVGLPKYT